MKKEKKHEVESQVTDQSVEMNDVNVTTNESLGHQNEVSIASEIEELNQKCADLTDKNLRLMAEFDNYRKRTLKEKSELIKTASENLLVNMLPLIDDFERAMNAMEQSEDVQAIKEGIDLIYSKFIVFLKQQGVTEIVTPNQVFDTDKHEAITTIPAPSEDLKGKIVDCVSKGYTLNEKVIRYSKVVVGE